MGKMQNVHFSRSVTPFPSPPPFEVVTGLPGYINLFTPILPAGYRSISHSGVSMNRYYGVWTEYTTPNLITYKVAYNIISVSNIHLNVIVELKCNLYMPIEIAFSKYTCSLLSWKLKFKVVAGLVGGDLV